MKRRAGPASSSKTPGVQAVDRALMTLNCFKEGDEPLSLIELAERTGFYKSMLLRLLSSLEQAGYIYRLPDKRFALGAHVMRMASIYQRMYKLEDHVRPILKRLVRTTEESASFFVRQKEHRVCLFRENSIHGLRDHVLEGDLAPINKGASSHVLTHFAGMRTNEVSAKLQASLPIFSFEETHKGTSGGAVPVFGQQGVFVGALTISGPLSRLTNNRLVQLTPLLLKSGRELSSALGAPDYEKLPQRTEVSPK